VVGDQRLLDVTKKIPHNARTFFQRQDQVADPLYVCTAIFNPIRFRSRWKLFQDFEARVAQAGAILYTIEAAFGNRAFAVTDPNNPRHIRVRCPSEIWLKENLLNVAIGRLPEPAKYIAWIDADVSFVRDDWANECIHQLQHYEFVQMWSEAIDMSPGHEILQRFKSFAWCHMNGVKSDPEDRYYYGPGKMGWWHPGFAWAARRTALDAVGGLVDWAILGSGDHLMARALVGRLIKQQEGIGPSGRRWLAEWKKRAYEKLHNNVGCMEGTLIHYWHGKKVNRGYATRWKILRECGFDEEKDIRRDAQGIWRLRENNIKLRDAIRAYFRQRNEDGIDV